MKFGCGYTKINQKWPKMTKMRKMEKIVPQAYARSRTSATKYAARATKTLWALAEYGGFRPRCAHGGGGCFSRARLLGSNKRARDNEIESSKQKTLFTSINNERTTHNTRVAKNTTCGRDVKRAIGGGFRATAVEACPPWESQSQSAALQRIAFMPFIRITSNPQNRKI